MNTSNEVFIYAFFAIISLIIFYYIIRHAVVSATKEQVGLLKRQNELLVMLLNQSGVSKDELMDLFVNEKKEFWINLKNHEPKPEHV